MCFALAPPTYTDTRTHTPYTQHTHTHNTRHSIFSLSAAQFLANVDVIDVNVTLIANYSLSTPLAAAASAVSRQNDVIVIGGGVDAIGCAKLVCVCACLRVCVLCWLCVKGAV